MPIPKEKPLYKIQTRLARSAFHPSRSAYFTSGTFLPDISLRCAATPAPTPQKSPAHTRAGLLHPKLLFRSKQTVAGVSEAGVDVGVVVEAFVDCGDVDRDVGVVFLDAFDAFRGGDDADEFDVTAAPLF